MNLIESLSIVYAAFHLFSPNPTPLTSFLLPHFLSPLSFLFSFSHSQSSFSSLSFGGSPWWCRGKRLSWLQWWFFFSLFVLLFAWVSKLVMISLSSNYCMIDDGWLKYGFLLDVSLWCWCISKLVHGWICCRDEPWRP